MKKRSSEEPRGHLHEIYGLVFLALGIFLILVLFSYDAGDPSFSTLATGNKVQNLGGVVGAYLTDIAFMALGYGAYLLPFSLLVAAFIEFSRQFSKKKSEIQFWRGSTILSGMALVFITSLLAHLHWDRVDIGGRYADAGGVVGFWAGRWFVQFFGKTGSYLFMGSGFLVSLLLLTRFSLSRFGAVIQAAGVFMGKLCFHFFQKTSSATRTFVTVAWVRSRKALEKFMKDWRKRRRDREEPKVNRVERVSPSIATQAASLPPASSPSAVSSTPATLEQLIAAEVSEPKILPRADLEDLKAPRKKEQMQLSLPFTTDYQLPQISFLDSESQETIVIDEESLKMNSKLLEKKLLDYGVEGKITEIHPGPVITMYEFEPAAGVKVNKIVNLEDDLSLTMGGKSVRIVAPLPGKPAVGIEIPNSVRETVWLKDVIGHPKFQKADSPMTLAIGKNTEGIPYISDLAKMPHLLMAGATGSGKSVSVNTMILSILYKANPDQVRLILIDPKMLELSIYEGIPHLLLPVVTHPRKASLALRWGVQEMEKRYELLSLKGARNIAGYNKLVPKEDQLPYIVIIIDELADLMMTAAKDVEVSVTRLAQMARAAGIHLILATQRPSVDVLTGLIKANFPARISFRVSSKHDSRTILDMIGSENLLGMGDMLFMSGGASSLLRIHAPYVSETEIVRIVDHWKKQGTPQYLEESILKSMEDEMTSGEGGEKKQEEDLSDDLYDQAVSIVTETRQASISMVQRRLRIGYNRAARMIERMEKEGVVGPADGARPREVYANTLSS